MITKFDDIDVSMDLETKIETLINIGSILLMERPHITDKLSDISYKNLIRIKELLDAGKIDIDRFEKLKQSILDNPESVIPISKNGNKSFPRSPLNEAVHNVGYDELEEMSDEAYDKLASKSHTLHFQSLLGLQSLKSTITLDEGVNRTYEREAAPLGVLLKSDEPIVIPRIKEEILMVSKEDALRGDDCIGYFDGTKLIAKSFDIFDWEDVSAGEEFHLNMYEVMRFIIQDQYAGYCSVEGDPRGVYFSVKGVNSFEMDDQEGVVLKEVKGQEGYYIFPTPFLNFKPRYGAVKDQLSYVDEITPDKKWTIRVGYERFKRFIPKNKIDLNVVRNQHFIFSKNSKIACLLQRDLGLTNGEIQKPTARSERTYIESAQDYLGKVEVERFESLGDKSKTLYVVQQLRMFAKRSLGYVETELVGVTIISDIDIKVPVLPQAFDNTVGVDPEQIKYIDVRAKEEVHLTLFEFMYLLLQDEYVGLCRIKGSKDNVELGFVGLREYLIGRIAIPTPELITKDYNHLGVKEIYRETENGIEILPEFIKKFGHLNGSHSV